MWHETWFDLNELNQGLWNTSQTLPGLLPTSFHLQNSKRKMKDEALPQVVITINLEKIVNHHENDSVYVWKQIVDVRIVKQAKNWAPFQFLCHLFIFYSFHTHSILMTLMIKSFQFPEYQLQIFGYFIPKLLILYNFNHM